MPEVWSYLYPVRDTPPELVRARELAPWTVFGLSKKNRVLRFLENSKDPPRTQRTWNVYLSIPLTWTDPGTAIQRCSGVVISRGGPKTVISEHQKLRKNGQI